MRLAAAVVLLTLAAPAAAQADWGRPTPLAAGSQDSYAMGVAADARDHPSALVATGRTGAWSLRLGARRIAESRSFFESAGLFAGRGDDLVAGWLQIINGSRLPVVATGPGLANRQVLAPGPRSTQVIRLAANRGGDAGVAFWRYDGQAYSVYAAYRRGGERFGPAQLLAKGFVSDPAVAIDADGNAVVAWSDRGGVRVAERAAGAGAFGAPATVPSPERPDEPGVAIEVGHVAVSWVVGAISGPRRVLVAERASAGATFGAPAAVNAADVRIPHWIVPRVSVAGGQVLVAWVQGAMHTTTHDVAALAVRSGSGGWQAPILRGVKGPEHISSVQLLARAAGRPPILQMTAQRRGRFRLLTATLRSDLTLAPSRTLAVGGNAGYSPWLAQGRRHAWLAAERVTGSSRHPRIQALLFRSS